MVFVIVIILLVIEIYVLWLGIVDDYVYFVVLYEFIFSFMGFVLSFLVIGVLWVVYYCVFGLLVDYDSGLVMLNLLLFMVIVFMLFVMVLMSVNLLVCVLELFYVGMLFIVGLL